MDIPEIIKEKLAKRRNDHDCDDLPEWVYKTVISIVFVLLIIGLGYLICFYEDKEYWSKITDKDTNKEYILKCNDANSATINNGKAIFTQEGTKYYIKNSMLEEKFVPNLKEYRKICK